MYLSNWVSVLLSTAFVAHQVSCGYQIASWWNHTAIDKENRLIKEATASIRVPAGSDPEETYWSAFQFSGGYIGMQHNFGSERRFLFSVWDDGNGGSVDTLGKSDNAVVEPFGHEGTGSHAMLHYEWKVEEPVFFKVTAEIKPDLNGSVYTGYYSVDEGKNWNLIASFFRQNIVKYLINFASFLEQINNRADNTDPLREGYWGNISYTTVDNTNYKVDTFTFLHIDYKSGGRWEQKTHIGPNNEFYQRIGGTKDQGIYPPTDTPNYAN